MCVPTGESVDQTQRLTPASLRARIAETRVRQWRVAQRLGVAEVHLSHVLVERKATTDDELARIAQAIDAEALAAEATA
jgi:plasmid maintenance system antidote protein VapI